MKNLSYIALILAGFVALQWHDNYTAERIAIADAQAAQAIAASVKAYSIECEPVRLAEVVQ